MKYYNNFNDMYNSNTTHNSCSVFNYSDYDGADFKRDIEFCICDAVDEWYDGLSNKGKENFAKFGLEWFDETGQGDKLCHTKGYKNVCDMIIHSGVEYTMRMMDESTYDILYAYLDKKYEQARNDYMNRFNFATDYDGEDDQFGLNVFL